MAVEAGHGAKADFFTDGQDRIIGHAQKAASFCNARPVQVVQRPHADKLPEHPANDIAQARGQTLAEMALAWLLSHDEITTVLIGASKTSQILDNIKAVQNTSFTAEELEAIDRISK